MVISALLLCKSIFPLLCIMRFVVVVYKYVTQASNVVSTWEKFDGHNYQGYPVICKCFSLLLWKCIVICLQIFEHMSAL